MPWSQILVALAVIFLVGHLLLDLRTIGSTLRHPKDLALTLLTVGFLVGHIVLDFIGG